jgi:hypothetical protein
MLVFAPPDVKNEPPVEVFRFCMVPPFNRQTEFAVGANDSAVSTLNVAPLLIVRPEVVSVLVDVPECRTVPSSTVIEVAVCGAVVVTVNAPVASVLAEKTASSPAAQVVPADPPVESVVQFAVDVSQLPVGVVPPAPEPAPFMSQYLMVARLVIGIRPTAATAETRTT